MAGGDAKEKDIDPKRRVLSDDPFETVVTKFVELYAKKNNRTWKETQSAR